MLSSLMRPGGAARAACSLPRSTAVRLALGCCLSTGYLLEAHAAKTAPPMLDINAQCEAVHKKNADAMSECVVAESEARADVLQKWDKVPDATAAGCLKLLGKGKRHPYGILAKCLADDAPRPTPAAAK